MEQFVASGHEIALSCPVSGTLGIVDASFNPPNYAHAKLAMLCREYYPDCTIVLMLATGNADKPAAPLDQLVHRYEMMKLLANEIGGSVSLALTTQPFFVNKARALHKNAPDSLQIYAMGFDTLYRILDQKYYQDPVVDVMSNLFEYAQILALTRNADEISGSVNLGLRDQLEYAGKNIKMVTATGQTNQVSSSRARKAYSSGDFEELARICPQSIIDYIKSNSLY